MITPGIKKIVENNAIGFSTVDKIGKPHSIAVAYVKVMGNKLIITNTHIKESIKNLENNKNVALVVWNKNWETACAGFELKGTAEHYESGKWADYVKNMPENKGYNVKGAIVVSIEKIKRLSS